MLFPLFSVCSVSKGGRKLYLHKSHDGVSIPFKRESVWQAWEVIFEGTLWLIVFRFPSSGKVHCKRRHNSSSAEEGGVSIPFKRESVSQVAWRRNKTPSHFCFHSLQTGKWIQRQNVDIRTPFWDKRFPFPSNGKAYRKCSCWRRYWLTQPVFHITPCCRYFTRRSDITAQMSRRQGRVSTI